MYKKANPVYCFIKDWQYWLYDAIWGEVPIDNDPSLYIYGPRKSDDFDLNLTEEPIFDEGGEKWNFWKYPICAAIAAIMAVQVYNNAEPFVDNMIEIPLPFNGIDWKKFTW